MNRQSLRPAVIAAVALCTLPALLAQTGPTFQISYSSSANPGPITGRLVLVVAQKPQPEPRLLVSPSGPAIFGMDIDQLAAGQTVTLQSANSIGSPVALSDLPAGDYFAQAIIDVYTQVHRSDGHTIWVHINDGTQETFNIAVGNLYSDVQPIHLGSTEPVKIEIKNVIPTRKPPADTEWVKHIRMESQKLTAFWGRPVFINATVLLPKGYAEHPNSHYPVVFTMGHNTPFSFSTEKASEREQQQARATGLQTGYDFYQSWTSDHFPRFVAISFQQQTPFFPDSYSINSANQGPYGDAMIEEMIPFLEKQFRLIPKGYARQLEGASTGGWQTLALQLYHPDDFGGAWILQPDPIDFRHYQLSNIYQDQNALSIPTGPFTSTERPMRRAVNGQVVWTQRLMSRFEAALGSHGRSSYQLEAWEALYGPVGADGYPVPLWDKMTGKIDKTVADYMRDHGYDLRAYAEKNWSTLGPKLAGKLHFFAGDMDDFYLNLAVYDFEEFAKSTQNPHSDADFTFARPMKGHSWHSFTWAEYVQKMGQQVKRNAPNGEDIAQWNY